MQSQSHIIERVVAAAVAELWMERAVAAAVVELWMVNIFLIQMPQSRPIEPRDSKGPITAWASSYRKRSRRRRSVVAPTAVAAAPMTISEPAPLL